MKTKEVTYVYDVFDRRIAKDVDDNGDGTIDRGERYVYDGSDVALVYDESDNLVERLLHGPGVDQPLASEDAAGDVLWFLADNQGTIRDVAEHDAVSDTTSVVNHIQYGGFGNITAQSNASLEPRHTYTGREWDADADLFYYRARWYDPTVGRFISEDPIGFSAGDANLSRYVGNGPINQTDPSGLWGWDGDWLQMGVGGLLGFYGSDVAGEGWSQIDEGAAATADGVIPFWDPFESYYADECGNVADIYRISRNLGAFSRDIALIAAIPNIGTWARNPAMYEIGSTTVSAELYATMQGMNAIQRGQYLVATYGPFGWILQTAPGQFVGGAATVLSGLTPGASLVSIGLAEAVDYYLRN